MCFRHIRSIMYRSKITLCILDRFWPAQLSNIFELKSEQILFPLNWTGFWIWPKTDPKWWNNSLRRAKEIIGLNFRSLQERLLREPSLDSTKTIDTCRTVEVTRSHAHTIQNGNSLAEFDANEINANLELSLPKLPTNLSFVPIRTKGDPVLLMENLVTIAKRRDIFQSVVRILIQKLTLSNKIWIIVTQTQNFSAITNHFYRRSWRWGKLLFRKRVDNWLISKPDTTVL